MNINISSTFPGLVNALNQLPSKIQNQVLRPALKQTVDTGKVALVREITRNFNIARTEVTSSIRSFVSETPRITNGGLTYKATILTSSQKRSLNVIRFIEKSISLAQSRKRNKLGTRNQLHAKIKKTGGYKSLGNRAFVGNKGRTVFYREEGSRKIHPFQTINISQMSASRNASDVAVDRINEVLENRINNQLKRVLSRL